MHRESGRSTVVRVTIGFPDASSSDWGDRDARLARSMVVRPLPPGPPNRNPTVPDVLLATGNPHKLDEVRAVLAPLGWHVLGLGDLPGDTPPEPEEDGDTFAANARIKACA